MNAHRLAVFLLCLVAVGAATADPLDFSYLQGPGDAVIAEGGFEEFFHSYLTNTGDNAEAYIITVTGTQPDDWTFGPCYYGVCYAPFPIQTSYRLPLEGTVAPGEEVEVKWSVGAYGDPGQAEYTLEVACESDPSITRTFTYTCGTPQDGRHMLFSVGESVQATGDETFIQFHAMLFNAGTETDSYTMTVERDAPANWSLMYCVAGTCYSPMESSIELPVGGGEYGPAAMELLDFDFNVGDSGTAYFIITIRSNTDPSIFSVASYTVTTGDIVGVDTPALSLLSDLKVSPNPFNPRADIRFTVGGETARDAVVHIFNAAGRHVRTLSAGSLVPGDHSVTWNGVDSRGQQAATGTYLARVSVGGTQQTVKMSLVK